MEAHLVAIVNLLKWILIALIWNLGFLMLREIIKGER